MRLEKAVWHNMGPHSDYELDLTALPDGARLVALTGPNGRGKSFSLEAAVAGACYRTMPTQGTLAKRATATDSWQESTLCHGGHRYRIKHLVNGGTGKGETLCLVDDGSGTFVPAYGGGTGFKTFDGWAARQLPDPDVLFASVFAAQQQEGFIAMTSGERIAVVLRVLGVARYERMAEAFRKRRAAAADKLAELGRRITDIRGGSKPVALCEAELEAAIGAVAMLQELATAAEQALAAGKESEAHVRIVATQRDAAVRELAGLQEQLEQVQQKRAPVAERVRNNRAVQAEGDAIRAAEVRAAALRGELAELEPQAVAAKAAVDVVLAPWADVMTRLATEQERLRRAEARLRDADAVQAAKTEVAALRDAVQEAEAEVSRAAAKLEELQATHLAGAEERIGQLRGGLDSIREAASANVNVEAGDLAAMAAESLEDDDTAVAMARELPALQRTARERLTAAKTRHADAMRQLAEAERLAARGPEVDAAEGEKREADAELLRLRAGHAGADAEAQATAKAHVALALKADTARAELATLKPLLDRATPLANAETRLAELEPQLAAFDADASRLEAAIAALPPLPAVPERPDLNRLEDAADRAHNALSAGQQGVTRAEHALEQARAVDAKVAGLEVEAATAQAELEHWSRLALDFGRDGIQSAEVDSAGPELTELINDLLRTCHGPRFTVSVETQRLNADGKKTIEECNIRVIDTVAGTDKEVREHSGGERVILGEAISLALTMLACRRAGWERPTLIRDESAAALDPGNARAWVAMMRRAVELTGADRLLFVSHSPEVIEMADHRIEVGAPSATEARAA
jgi:exonuclease SbcC